MRGSPVTRAAFMSTPWETPASVLDTSHSQTATLIRPTYHITVKLPCDHPRVGPRLSSEDR